MIVCCLNWNDYLGRGAEYVRKLGDAVYRNLTIPYEFVVVDEGWEGIDAEGWWNKIAILGMFDEPTMFLDLDVVITSNIDHIVQQAWQDVDRVWMRDDFSYSIVNPKIGLSSDFTKTLGGVGTCNSSVMIWSKAHKLDPPEHLLRECHGDQNVITNMLWAEDKIGLLNNDDIHSYKYHPGQIAPIVVFHGKPKPHEVPDQWVKGNWI